MWGSLLLLPRRLAGHGIPHDPVRTKLTDPHGLHRGTWASPWHVPRGGADSSRFWEAHGEKSLSNQACRPELREVWRPLVLLEAPRWPLQATLRQGPGSWAEQGLVSYQAGGQRCALSKQGQSHTLAPWSSLVSKLDEPSWDP